MNSIGSALVIGAVTYRLHTAALPPDAIRLEQVLVGAGIIYAVPAMAVRALRWTGHRRIQAAVMVANTALATAVLAVAAPHLPDFLPLTCLVFATMVLNFDLGLEPESFAAVAAIPCAGIAGLWAYYVWALHGSLGAALTWAALFVGVGVLAYLTLRMLLDRGRLAEEHVRTVLESVGEGILTIDSRGVIESANPAVRDLFGEAPAGLRGRTVQSLLASGEGAAFETYLGEQRGRSGVAARVHQSVAQRRDAGALPVDLLLGSLRPAGAGRFLLTVRDASTGAALQPGPVGDALQVDSLTGLADRTLFQDRLAQALQTARHSGEVFAVLLVDLNRFQDVNDAFGHEAGDQLLARAAERIRRACRGADTVARLSGDEFAVVTGLAHGSLDPITLGRKILGAVEEPFHVMGREVRLGASIGVSLYPDHGDEARVLTSRADAALSVAKRERRTLEVFKPEHEQSASRRLTLGIDLARAVSEQELRVLYQPVVDLATGRPVKVEALVRWAHPRDGLISPDAFIPLAEENGLIGQVTTWVLEAALEDLARWRAEGYQLGVAVNISAHDLREHTFVSRVNQLVHRLRVPVGQVTLEITEGHLLTPEATPAVKRLHDLGVKLALDDFGAGYSSLGYLGRLPVSQLKIDRSFVLELTGKDDSDAIVRSAIELGHALGLGVVAEGLETEIAREHLLRLGCDYGQGYLVGRPMDLDSLRAWLADQPSVRRLPEGKARAARATV